MTIILDSRVQRWGVRWCFVLGFGVLGWWSAVLSSSMIRDLFIPRSFGLIPLLAYAPADALLILLPLPQMISLFRKGDPNVQGLLILQAGALGYSALTSIGASFIANTAWLGPLLMLTIAGIAANFAWVSQPATRWFREAPPQTVIRRMLRTIQQALIFNLLFLVLLPRCVFGSAEQLGIYQLGWNLYSLIFILFIALLNLIGLGISLQLAIRGNGTPLPIEAARQLVISGAYAHLRNPMAMIGIAQGVLLALAFGSWPLLIYAVGGGVLWNFFVRPLEEHDLMHRFGNDFLQYQTAVRCWIPSLRPWHPDHKS